MTKIEVVLFICLALLSDPCSLFAEKDKALVQPSQNYIPRIIELRIIDKNTVFLKSDRVTLLHFDKNGGMIEDHYFIAAESGKVVKRPDLGLDELVFSVGESCELGGVNGGFGKLKLLKIEKENAVFEYEYGRLGKITKRIISVKPYKTTPNKVEK